MMKSMKYVPGDFLLIPNVSKIVKMKPSHLSVYVALLRFADDNGECWPSRATLSQVCGISIRNIDRCLENLVKAGIIKKDVRKSELGDNLTNFYTIQLLPPPELSQVKPKLSGADLSPGGSAILSSPSDKNSTGTISNELYINTGGETPKETFKVNKYFDAFAPVNPSFKAFYRNKTQREAMKRLVDTHGDEKVMWLIAQVVANKDNADPYYPFVASPYELEAKLAKLRRYFTKPKAKDE